MKYRLQNSFLILISLAISSCQPTKSTMQNISSHSTEGHRPFFVTDYKILAKTQILNSKVDIDKLKLQNEISELQMFLGQICRRIVPPCPGPGCKLVNECPNQLPIDIFALRRRDRVHKVEIRDISQSNYYQANTKPLSNTKNGVNIDYSEIPIIKGSAVEVRMQLKNSEVVSWTVEKF